MTTVPPPAQNKHLLDVAPVVCRFSGCETIGDDDDDDQGDPPGRISVETGVRRSSVLSSVLWKEGACIPEAPIYHPAPVYVPSVASRLVHAGAGGKWTESICFRA